MKNFKVVAALTSLAAVLCMPAISHAQLTSPQINAVGSSGAFTTVVISMASPDPTVFPGGNPVCGSKVWTNSSASLVYAKDPRGSVPNEPGTIAVVWDNDTNPTIICSYFSVDSIVGDRLLLAQTGGGGVSGNGYIVLDPTVQTTPGANKVAYVKDTATSGLPSAVYGVLANSHFNVAFTDIRPDDAEYAINRASCTPADQVKCFGYGPAPTGTAILSSFDTSKIANTVSFAISGGTDPFTTLTVPATTTINIGAYPVVIIYNTTDTSTNGFGTLLPKNVLSHVINGFWGGRLQGTQDFTGLNVSGPIVDVVQREPISGTYNTFEFQGVGDRDADINYSQETGVVASYGQNCFTPATPATYARPTVTCQNPMSVPGPGAGYNRKLRAIGTGDMVSAVDSTNGANRIGYSFFGLGTFGGKTHTRYVTVDGVDPLFPNYPTNGDMSSLCSGFVNSTPAFACTNNPTFDGVISGNYRLWNVIRAVRYSSYTPPASGPSVDGLILAAQDQSHSATGPHDFVPYRYCASTSTPGSCTSPALVLPVFRVHYPLQGITVGVSDNGNTGCSYETGENGGDMAGAILPVFTDQSYCNITGGYFTDYIQ